MLKPMYIVVCCMGGHLNNFYKATEFGFRNWTGRVEEAKRLPWEVALKIQDHRTFAIKESNLAAWLADPPKSVRAILERQASVMSKNQPAKA